MTNPTETLQDLDSRMDKTLWFPGVHQVFFEREKKPSYLHSVFIGFTTPIMNLPSVIVLSILSPLFRGVLNILKMLILMPVLGLSGKLTTHNITFAEAKFLASVQGFSAWVAKHRVD